jgi:hypothetical protein
MELESIEQQELTASERAVLAEDRTRWKRMGAGSHLDEWLSFGPGLMIRRHLAMKLAHVNKPEGRGYAQYFARLMKHDGMDFDDSSTKTSLTAVLWLHDQPERLAMLREIREVMTLGERSRLNSPISARQRVEKMLKARAGGSESKMRESPIAKYKQKIVELERQLAQRGDGSLFDLRKDYAKDIAATIAQTIGESRWRSIRKEIDAAFKR